ncbi:timeless protein [Dictyocaulus viviparus]|uniref:Timeless protein n=1 Tax=Dictyocaulus viviparus TaxID=29172 RepID=A0A0D8XRQ5_DICVI|nr:timeless protein [Dictyocaulus viviparus]
MRYIYVMVLMMAFVGAILASSHNWSSDESSNLHRRRRAARSVHGSGQTSQTRRPSGFDPSSFPFIYQGLGNLVMEVVIQGTISALGFQENGIYYQEPDCYETIRDLIRFLRNDTSVLLARRICGERNIIGNDLIPIIKSENLDGKVFDVALRLLVNLTQPAVVSLQGKQPESTEEWQRFWVLEENLKKAKSAFADTQLFLVLKQRLENYFMETVWEDRLEEDRLVMERIIVLLRYVFAISHTEGDEKRTATESNCHDRVVNAFLDSGIQKVLVHIALQSKEREFHLSILAIFSLIIKEHNPADIVVAGRTRNISEKEKAEEDLRHIVEVEQARLTMQRKRLLANRHPMFSGSYVVKGIPALNKNRDLIVNKPIKSLGELSFLDERKAKKAIAKNRRPFEGVMRTHLSSVDLRLKLKSFIEEILLSCFNCLYKSTKDLAFDLRLSAGQRDSDLHFFFLIKFLLEYTRLAERSSTEVSVCLSIEAFHHIQVQLCNYMESAATLKREAKQYGIRAQYSLSAYKELVLFLQYLIDKGSPDEKDNAQRISFHILIVEEYREMGLSMIRKFSTTFLSKTFLRELVLSNHYYLRLLENAVKTGQLNTVKKRSKIRRKIRRSRKDSVAPESLLAVVDNLSSEDLSLKWSSITDQIKDIILGNMESSTDQIPINSLLDVQEEQHQKFAMLKVQRAMREGRAQDAMGLYRASRELWPTDGIFGDPDSNAEDQLAEIREIFFTDLKDVVYLLYENQIVVNFDFPQYVAKFAKADVLRWYVFLLNDFLTNSVELNKALVKFLHRVSFDLNMPSRLFQLSLFRIFSQLRKYFNTLSKEKMKTSSLYQLFNFGYHLLRKFFACYSNLGDRLAPEVLFWKGHKECYEIQNGYGTYDSVKNVEDSTSLWTEELEIELRSLYNEYRDMDERPEGMDILDFIEPNLSRPRTRKQIFKKLKEFALDPLGAKVNKG